MENSMSPATGGYFQAIDENGNDCYGIVLSTGISLVLFEIDGKSDRSIKRVRGIKLKEGRYSCGLFKTPKNTLPIDIPTVPLDVNLALVSVKMIVDFMLR